MWYSHYSLYFNSTSNKWTKTVAQTPAVFNAFVFGDLEEESLLDEDSLCVDDIENEVISQLHFIKLLSYSAVGGGGWGGGWGCNPIRLSPTH